MSQAGGAAGSAGDSTRGGPGGVFATPEAMHGVQSGLSELGDVLSAAVHSADSLPVEALRPVLGAVGARFMDALVAATARHRRVLAEAAGVSRSAAAAVGGTAQLYEATDASSSAAIGRAGAGRSGVVRT